MWNIYIFLKKKKIAVGEGFVLYWGSFLVLKKERRLIYISTGNYVFTFGLQQVSDCS